MGDLFWLGAAAVAVLAGVAVAALVHVADRRAQRDTTRRLNERRPARAPIQLVRDPPPLETPLLNVRTRCITCGNTVVTSEPGAPRCWHCLDKSGAALGRIGPMGRSG